MTLPGPSTSPSNSKPKQLADELAKKLQEAYDRGASAEVANLLLQEFKRLRREHDERLSALEKQVGL